MGCRALHPTRRAPSARADLPSDKGRLLERQLKESREGDYALARF